MKTYNIIYLGTEGNEKSFLGLKKILEHGYKVSLVITSKCVAIKQPHLHKADQLIGGVLFIIRAFRFIFKKIFQAKFAVKNIEEYSLRNLCVEKGIPVITYASSKIGDIEKIFYQFKPDVIIANGWCWYIPKNITRIAKIISLNCHSSYLPNYRGGNVTFAPLINEELYSGVTVHEITEKFDSGRILSQISINISKDETPDSLNEKRAKVTGQALINALKVVDQPQKYKKNPPSPFYKRFSYESYLRLKIANKIRSMLGLKKKRVKPIYSNDL